jgi:hypothetical protein
MLGHDFGPITEVGTPPSGLSGDSLPADARVALEAQLNRMRGMLYGYYDQFYRFLNVQIVAILAVLAAALVFDRRLALVLPFHIVFVGFHSAFLFSYVSLARMFATAIERRLNRHFRSDYLIAHQLESAYIFPMTRRRFVAFSPANPGSFLSAETAQFTFAGGLLYVVSAVWAIRVALDQGTLWGMLYTLAMGLYSLGCLGYLIWYHYFGEYERRLRTILERRYDVNLESEREIPT